MEIPEHKETKNEWIRPLLILVPYLFSVGVFQLLAFYFLGLDIKNVDHGITTTQHVIISLFTLAGTILIIYFFKSIVDKESFRSLGFYNHDTFKLFLGGLLTGFIIISIGFFTLLIFKQIQIHSVNTIFPEIVLCLILFLSVSISEEIFFRGYVLRNLLLSINSWISLLISSVFFSVVHIFNSDISCMGLLNIFLAGVMLGIPYLYTHNIWYSISLHFSWNFVQGTLYGFNVSGQEIYSVINHTLTFENSWNGGHFGFEGSILSIVLEIIAIYFIWIYFKRKHLSKKH